MSGTSLNPMMRQYWEFKSRYQNCLLFFRLGDFYEMFFEDAERASRLLGLTLTARGSGGDRAPMCGVPYHSAQGYIAKLLKHGERVAICEQVEDARKAKGLVRRDVVRVLTPGTLVESALLTESVSNYLCAVAGTEERLAVASVELSTGEFMATMTEGPEPFEEARDELHRLSPAECLGSEEALSRLRLGSVTCTPVQEIPRPASARTALLEHFQVASLVAFGCEDAPAIQQAAAILLDYLGRTHRNGLAHLKGLVTYSPRSFLRLDPFTIDALEVVAPPGRDQDGPTLLSVIDHTRSAMGSRTLRRWLLRPLVRAGEIMDRHDAVEWLVDRQAELAALRERLGACADLERVSGRIGGLSAGARDLVAVAETLERVREVRETLDGAGAPGVLGELAAGLEECPDLRRRIGAALVPDPPLAVTEGGLIRDGYHAEVDELRKLSKSGKDMLLELQARERQRTGIETLKVQYNSVFGYFIEISKGKAHLAPAGYQRKQTLANAERYVTPELKELENRVLGAHERLAELEHRLFVELRATVAERDLPALLGTGRALGALDAVASLADVAARNGYVRPVIDAGGLLEIVDGRHPVLERVQKTFVSNDVRLDPEGRHVLVITGPNMAGKSTYLRQTALLTLMAHAGSFVPAKEARIPVVDGIYCRIGASDRLSRGLSTFMVEMTEVAQILNHASRDSLLIFDEVGRGTSTYDGIAIAWAIVEHAARELRAKTLFATHYYELTALAESVPAVGNANVLVREWKNDLVFLYRIEPGRADRSYGVQVAKLAGIPEGVLARARTLLKEFEHAVPKASARRDAQLSLFEPLPDGVRQRLEDADLDALTPLEAMNLVHELKRMLKDGAAYPEA